MAGQVGLPGNEVELADFQVRADGGGEPTLGDIAGRVAQNPVVPGIRQPEVVLGIERDRPYENGAVVERDPIYRRGSRLAQRVVDDSRIEAGLSDAQVRDQLIRRRGERFAETQNPVVAAIGHVEIALIHRKSCGRAETGGQASGDSRAIGAGGEEVALPDYQVCELAVGEVQPHPSMPGCGC